MQLSETVAPDETDVALKELFWRQGYEHASIEDVVKATGLNRYALYSSYGGKRELFLAALDAYYRERKIVFLRNLNDPETAPLDAVRRVFEFAIAEMAERRAGCLLCNVATEHAAADDIIAERITAYLEEIQMAYAEALSRAAARGELKTGLDPQDGARLLIAVKLGIGVRAKAGASGEEMVGIFNSTMSILTGEKAKK